MVAGNVSVNFESCSDHARAMRANNCNIKTENIIQVVGINYACDNNMRPTKLSGSMDDRGSLSLQVTHHKHIIILDYPFMGLDSYSDAETGTGWGVAFLLISHYQDI